MGTIASLRTKTERLRDDQAAALRQALLPFEDQMPDAVRALIGHIDRQTASRSKWTFIMLSPEQNAAVVDYLASHSERPIVALKLWALCFKHLRLDTGEIMLSRDEIAEQLGQRAREVSQIMGELEDCGAISRRRQRVAGLKGPGMVHYFMNPNVATHLSGAARDEAQRAASQPAKESAMKSGKPKSRASLRTIPGGLGAS